MSETTRLSRLTAILTLLLSKRLITSTEIARKFNISIRTVYRDIRALEESGVPIITEEGKGYSLVEGYKVPPIMFTEKESYALITSEQIILKNKDASLKEEFSSAVNKIKAVLKQSGQQKAELLTSRVHIGKNFQAQTTSKFLIDIQVALTNCQLLKIKYQKGDTEEVTERIIEPFAIYHNVTEDWTLAAYCRLRGDFRAFRLDRMLSVVCLDEFFPPHNLTIKQYIEKYTTINNP